MASLGGDKKTNETGEENYLPWSSGKGKQTRKKTTTLKKKRKGT